MFKKLIGWFSPHHKTKTGVVTEIQFTWGGDGNQITTIDGVRYWTWWNYATKDWELDDTVTFKTQRGYSSRYNTWYTEAYNIKKAT